MRRDGPAAMTRDYASRSRKMDTGSGPSGNLPGSDSVIGFIIKGPACTDCLYILPRQWGWQKRIPSRKRIYRKPNSIGCSNIRVQSSLRGAGFRCRRRFVQSKCFKIFTLPIDDLGSAATLPLPLKSGRPRAAKRCWSVTKVEIKNRDLLLTASRQSLI